AHSYQAQQHRDDDPADNVVALLDLEVVHRGRCCLCDGTCVGRQGGVVEDLFGAAVGEGGVVRAGAGHARLAGGRVELNPTEAGEIDLRPGESVGLGDDVDVAIRHAVLRPNRVAHGQPRRHTQ